MLTRLRFKIRYVPAYWAAEYGTSERPRDVRRAIRKHIAAKLAEDPVLLTAGVKVFI